MTILTCPITGEDCYNSDCAGALGCKAYRTHVEEVFDTVVRVCPIKDVECHNPFCKNGCEEEKARDEGPESEQQYRCVFEFRGETLSFQCFDFFRLTEKGFWLDNALDYTAIPENYRYWVSPTKIHYIEKIAR